MTAEAIAARTEVAALISEVAEGSKRLSELVAALKSYSFLDQAPVQNVDVAQGIEDTLLILKSKTAGIAIVRTYAPDVPVITAYGSRLNQVWTNLIDNAADAIRDAGIDDGRIGIEQLIQTRRGQNLLLQTKLSNRLARTVGLFGHCRRFFVADLRC